MRANAQEEKAMSNEGRGQAFDDLEYAGEKLIEDTWAWLVARPQRTDGVAWLKTLEQFLDARDRVKSQETKCPERR